MGTTKPAPVKCAEIINAACICASEDTRDN